jgi:endo-1,4-beta-xylanase
MVDPLIEFYIIDDYGTFKPAGVATDGSLRTHMGTFDVDGGTYDIWQLSVMDKPAITGDSEDFEQYWSVRQTSKRVRFYSRC